jgi:predicted metal-dependent hydrolase
MATLRVTIVDTINELNKLLPRTKDEGEKRKLRLLRNFYFNLLTEVLRDEIDSNTDEFKEAIGMLEDAQASIAEAKNDIARVAEVINQLNKGARAIDRVVKIGIGFVT